MDREVTDGPSPETYQELGIAPTLLCRVHQTLGYSSITQSSGATGAVPAALPSQDRSQLCIRGAEHSRTESPFLRNRRDDQPQQDHLCALRDDPLHHQPVRQDERHILAQRRFVAKTSAAPGMVRRKTGFCTCRPASRCQEEISAAVQVPAWLVSAKYKSSSAPNWPPSPGF